RDPVTKEPPRRARAHDPRHVVPFERENPVVRSRREDERPRTHDLRPRAPDDEEIVSIEPRRGGLRAERDPPGRDVTLETGDEIVPRARSLAERANRPSALAR